MKDACISLCFWLIVLSSIIIGCLFWDAIAATAIDLL